MICEFLPALLVLLFCVWDFYFWYHVIKRLWSYVKACCTRWAAIDLNVVLLVLQLLKLYKRFIKAESFRKALVYQKKYLLLLLGGFEECESTTLAMIAQMGAYPKDRDRSFRRTAISRFRTAGRAILAIQRMNFLVNKSKRVTITGSRDTRENTSRSRMVNGDLNSHDHSVYQAPSQTYAPRSTEERPGSVNGVHVAPTLHSYQPNGVPSYANRYSPRSDRRTRDKHQTGINGHVDFRSHTMPPTSASSNERLGGGVMSGKDGPLSHRSHVTSPSRSSRTFSPTSWSDTRSTSAPLVREPTTTDYTRTLKSPPVRDSVTTQRDYSHRDRLESSPRHSSPRRGERSGLLDFHNHHDRPLSPSRASSLGSAHNDSDSGDHSLNLYIHRLESLQNRLGAFDRGKTFPTTRSKYTEVSF